MRRRAAFRCWTFPATAKAPDHGCSSSMNMHDKYRSTTRGTRHSTLSRSCLPYVLNTSAARCVHQSQTRNHCAGQFPALQSAANCAAVREHRGTTEPGCVIIYVALCAFAAYSTMSNSFAVGSSLAAGVELAGRDPTPPHHHTRWPLVSAPMPKRQGVLRSKPYAVGAVHSTTIPEGVRLQLARQHSSISFVPVPRVCCTPLSGWQVVYRPHSGIRSRELASYFLHFTPQVSGRVRHRSRKLGCSFKVLGAYPKQH